MSQSAVIAGEQFAAGFRPDPKLTVSAWSDKHRILPQAASSEPGPWRTKRTPYLREIMDELSPSSRTEQVTFIKGAQIGATEAGNNWVGYVIHHAPGPMLLVQVTLDMAKRTSRQRIQPMIDTCPELSELVSDPRSRDSGNSMLMKLFPGGVFVATGSNSASGLRSMPARYLFLDEVDGYEHDVDGEGDPVELAKRRTATFKRTRKIFAPSTPTIRGLSRIEGMFERSDQRYYFVPCPECGHKAPLTWARIAWDKETDANGKTVHKPETAHALCESCGCRIEERSKAWFLAEENGAEWVATSDTGEPNHAGFHLSALYSPLGWYSWSDAVRELIAAKKRMETGDSEAMKTWVNTVLGESWAEPGQEVSHSALFSRREPATEELDPRIMCIVSGTDVQKDRLETTVYGVGADEEFFALGHHINYGDPSQEKDPVWDQLDQLLFHTSFKHPAGVELRIGASTIDSGYLASVVYQYVKTRQRRGVYAVKGVDGEGKPVVNAPSKKRTGKNRRPVHLFTVGTHEAKRLIFGRLLVKNAGPGFVHFPIKSDFDDEFFEQLTAEKLVTRYVRGFPKREWIKTRPRNEALDCFVYSLASLYILAPNFDALSEWFKLKSGEDVTTDAADDTSPTPRRGSRRRRAGGFTKGWK